jgi:hypothetical protein
MRALMTYAVPTIAVACAVHALLRLRSARRAASAAPSAAACAAAQGEDARAHRPAPCATLDDITDAFTHVRRRLSRLQHPSPLADTSELGGSPLFTRVASRGAEY